MEEVTKIHGLVTAVYALEGMIDVAYENEFDSGRVRHAELPNLASAAFGDRVFITIEKDG